MLFNLFDGLSESPNYTISRATCKSAIYFRNKLISAAAVLLSGRFLLPNVALAPPIIEVKDGVTFMYVQPLPRMGRGIILEYGVQ